MLCLRNMVPASLLEDRWLACHSAALFSATLSPARYLQDMLGLPDSSAWVDVPSAFDAQQLKVHVSCHISTRYHDREQSLASLVTVMADQFGQTPGNYFAFFSSFDYLTQAADAFIGAHPEIPVWLQGRRINEAARDAFWTGSRRTARALDSPCWAARLARGSICPASG